MGWQDCEQASAARMMVCVAKCGTKCQLGWHDPLTMVRTCETRLAKLRQNAESKARDVKFSSRLTTFSSAPFASLR